MKTLSLALALVIAAPLAFGQGQVGQVIFANKGNGFDAPVFAVPGFNAGPGPNFTAQLVLMGDNGALTPLMPTSTFRLAGVGAAAVADRYWWPQTVDVPGVSPGTAATFVVQAWQTSFGSYAGALAGGVAGQSAPFVVTVGGGLQPPANLTTLQAFTFPLPEPSALAITFLGSTVAIFVSRRKR